MGDPTGSIPGDGIADPHLELERGRESYGRRAWADAHRSLSLADQAAPLGVEDLELLAMSAYLIGRDDDCLRTLERVHHAHLDAGALGRASRSAFLLGFRLAGLGDIGRASGWLGRAARLLEEGEHDCAERGYLLLPLAMQQLGAGEDERAYATAASAVEIGNRFDEPDLIACARHLQGRALMQRGQVAAGLALLDEAMVAVIAGELSPLFTGVIYCSVIDGCQEVCALGRAREWTSALAQWCDEHPQMIAYSGSCLLHRAEIMQLRGDWQDALEEARRAHERFSELDQRAGARALYRQAEVHRLRGEFDEAEEEYRKTSEAGCEPQPGLAQLRMAQGHADAAAAMIGRVLDATRGRLQRTKFLPACIEIMLAAGDIERSRDASRELKEIAKRFDTDVLRALAAQGRGAVTLAEGDARAALGSLRIALETWRQVEAPYEVARVRVLTGLACRGVGDDEGARLEFDAAKGMFKQLGASPDVARIDAVTQRGSAHSAGLTSRELQVLRLVAAGKTNKFIAAELSLSEKTVERHVSNILTKLDVDSRTAAAAYAYEHKLFRPD